MNAFTHSKELRPKDVKVGLIGRFGCRWCYRCGYPCERCANFARKTKIMTVDDYNNETNWNRITLKEAFNGVTTQL